MAISKNIDIIHCLPAAIIGHIWAISFPNPINFSGRAVHTSATTTNYTTCPGELRRTLFTHRMKTRCCRACFDRAADPSLSDNIVSAVGSTVDICISANKVKATISDADTLFRSEPGLSLIETITWPLSFQFPSRLQGRKRTRMAVELEMLKARLEMLPKISLIKGIREKHNCIAT